MLAPWAWPVLLWIVGILGAGTWAMPGGAPRLAFAVLAAGILAFCLWFFRNPTRRPPPGDLALVAPADGVVDVVEEVDAPQGGRALKIGIFLSVFDVHVNRAPLAGTVTWALYQPGAFHDARRKDRADANEANTIAIAAAAAPGLTVHVRQAAGLIARRIVCAVGVGGRVERGGLYGMIRFGSRTEVYLPLSWRHAGRVRIGDRVVGGETIIAIVAPTADGDLPA
jgi:phosphatidylserine decarboxylase